MISNFSYAKCNSINVYEDIACHEKELKSQKTKLNHNYQKLFNSLDVNGKKVLESAQKNWLLYKNSHCDELVSYLSASTLGAGSQLINLSCNLQLIEQRSKQLIELAE